MRLFILIIATFIFTKSIQADSLSDCHNGCFDAKKTCNDYKTHTFNHCDQDLFSCRASCNSGKKQGSYSTTLPIDIAFQPILDLDQ